MRYTKPFNADKRQRAVQELRRHLRYLKTALRPDPPRTLRQFELLGELRLAIEELKRLLANDTKKIDVGELNRSDMTARWASLEYSVEKHLEKLR